MKRQINRKTFNAFILVSRAAKSIQAKLTARIGYAVQSHIMKKMDKMVVHHSPSEVLAQ